MPIRINRNQIVEGTLYKEGDLIFNVTKVQETALLQGGGATLVEGEDLPAALALSKSDVERVNSSIPKLPLPHPGGQVLAPTGLASARAIGNLSGCVQGAGLWWPLNEGTGTVCLDQFTGSILNLLGTAGNQWNVNAPGVTLNGSNNALQMPFAGQTLPAAWAYATARYCTNLASLAVGEAVYLWGIVSCATAPAAGFLFWSGLDSSNGWGVKISNQSTISFVHRGTGATSDDTQQFGLSFKGSNGNNTRTAFCLMVTPNANGTLECHLTLKYLAAPVRDNSGAILNIRNGGVNGSGPASYAAAQLTWGCQMNGAEGTTANFFGCTLLNLGLWRRERVAGLPNTIVQNLALNPKNFPAELLA